MASDQQKKYVADILSSKGDLAKVLGIEDDSTFADIKKKYRKLAILVHPDKNPSPDAAKAFQMLQQTYDQAEAYLKLRDQQRKMRATETIHTQSKATPPRPGPAAAPAASQAPAGPQQPPAAAPAAAPKPAAAQADAAFFFNCPKCGQRLRTFTAYVDMMFNCLACGHMFRIEMSKKDGQQQQAEVHSTDPSPAQTPTTPLRPRASPPGSLPTSPLGRARTAPYQTSPQKPQPQPQPQDSFSSSSSSFDSSSDDGGGGARPAPPPPGVSSEALQAELRQQQQQAEADRRRQAAEARDGLLKPSAQKGPWTCPKCTALNLRKQKKCGTCKAPRPVDGTPAAAAAAAGAPTAADISPRTSAAASDRIKVFPVGKVVEVRRRDGRWVPCTVAAVDVAKQMYDVEGAEPATGERWSKTVAFAGTREPARRYSVGDYVEAMQKGQWVPCRVEEVDEEAEVYYLRGGGGDAPQWTRGVSFAGAALTLRLSDRPQPAADKKRKAPAKKAWRCGECGFQNKSGGDRCAVCGAKAAALKKARQQQGGEHSPTEDLGSLSSDGDGGFKADGGADFSVFRKDEPPPPPPQRQPSADEAAAWQQLHDEKAKVEKERAALAEEKERAALAEEKARAALAEEKERAAAAAAKEAAERAAAEETRAAQRMQEDAERAAAAEAAVAAQVAERTKALEAELKQRLQKEASARDEAARAREEALAAQLKALESDAKAQLDAAHAAAAQEQREKARLAEELAALSDQKVTDKARLQQLAAQKAHTQFELAEQAALMDTLAAELVDLRNSKASDDQQAAQKVDDLQEKLDSLARDKHAKEAAVRALEARVAEVAASEKEAADALEQERVKVEREARMIKMREAEVRIREENERRKARDAERRVQQAIERERVRVQLEAGRHRVAQLKGAPGSPSGDGAADPTGADVVLQAAMKNNVHLEAKLNLVEGRMVEYAAQETKLQQLLEATAAAYQEELGRIGADAESNVAEINDKLRETGAALADEKEMAGYFAAQVGELNAEMEKAQALLRDEKDTAAMFAAQIGQLTQETEAAKERCREEQEMAAFFAQQLVGAEGDVDVLRRFHVATKELEKAQEELSDEKECAAFFASQLTDQRKQLKDAAAAAAALEQELASERECAEFFAHEVTEERKKRKELEKAAATLEAEVRAAKLAQKAAAVADRQALAAEKDKALAAVTAKKDKELQALKARLEAMAAAPPAADKDKAPAKPETPTPQAPPQPARNSGEPAPAKPPAPAPAAPKTPAEETHAPAPAAAENVAAEALPVLPVLPEVDISGLDAPLPPPPGAAAPALPLGDDDPFDSDTSDEEAIEAARIFKALPKVEYEGAGAGYRGGVAIPPEPTVSTKASTALSGSSRASPLCPFPDDSDSEDGDVAARGAASDFWRTRTGGEDREGSYKDREGRGLFRCPYCDVGFPDELASIDLPATCPACRAPFLLLSSMLVMVCEDAATRVARDMARTKAIGEGVAAVGPPPAAGGPSYEDMKKKILQEHARREDLHMLGVSGQPPVAAAALELDLAKRAARPAAAKVQAAAAPAAPAAAADDYETRKRRILEAARVGPGLRAADPDAETQRLRELEAQLTTRCACGAAPRGRCILCGDDDDDDVEIVKAAAAREYAARGRAEQAQRMAAAAAPVEDDYEARKRAILEAAAAPACPPAAAPPAPPPRAMRVMCDCGSAERGKCLFCDDDD